MANNSAPLDSPGMDAGGGDHGRPSAGLGRVLDMVPPLVSTYARGARLVPKRGSFVALDDLRSCAAGFRAERCRRSRICFSACESGARLRRTRLLRPRPAIDFSRASTDRRVASIQSGNAANPRIAIAGFA